MKEISVYRIDYEIRSDEDGERKLWSACIAAYGQQEAIDYLGDFLKKTFKIIQIGRECRLDAVTEDIRTKISEGYLKDQMKDIKKKLIKKAEKMETKVTLEPSGKEEEDIDENFENVEVKQETDSQKRGRSLKKK